MNDHNPCTISNGTAHPVSLEKMLAAMREIDLLPKPTDWILVSPDGRMWRGDVQHIFCALSPHHPLLKGTK